jgi:hypothetical protein
VEGCRTSELILSNVPASDGLIRLAETTAKTTTNKTNVDRPEG